MDNDEKLIMLGMMLFISIIFVIGSAMIVL